jgi:putative transposase
MPQSLAKVYVHAVFSTKNREPTLLDLWRDDLLRVMAGSLKQLGCPPVLVGGINDHVHLLFELSRTRTIAETIQMAKVSTSTWINNAFPTPVPFHWQSGYGMFSVSQSNVDAVREYIANQAVHHEKQSFQDELRLWLQRYKMTWDERYVWD